MRQQIVHQLWIFDHRPDRLETAAVFPLRSNRQAINQHLGQTVGLHLVDKFGITHLLSAAAQVEVVEDREKNRGNQKPQQQIFGHIVHNDSSRFRNACLPRGRTV